MYTTHVLVCSVVRSVKKRGEDILYIIFIVYVIYMCVCGSMYMCQLTKVVQCNVCGVGCHGI